MVPRLRASRSSGQRARMHTLTKSEDEQIGDRWKEDDVKLKGKQRRGRAKREEITEEKGGEMCRKEESNTGLEKNERKKRN
ncbi:unnamed protein product [Lasius platythorax]|uniref:Uncharacterized protein n=1 Tax=Lasius platythorax TaxID=488582 RepID=A0AAV2NTP1_9HYME